MKMFFSVLLVFCFIAVGSAQERILGKAEFENVIVEGSQHQLKWKDEKYRMTVTTSSRAVDRPQTDWSSKMIFEYGPSEELRTVTTSAFGEKTLPTKEFIKVGGSVYQRLGNGTWTRKEAGAAAGQIEKTTTEGKTVTSEVEYKYLGADVLKGKPVKIYLKTERGTSTTEKGEKVDSATGAKYWVGADGLILKSENTSESRGSNLTSRSLITTEWELDPSIKFTVPDPVN